MWKVLIIAVELGAEAAEERAERIAREERNRALVIAGVTVAAIGAAGAGAYAYMTSDEEEPAAIRQAPTGSSTAEDADTWWPWPFE